MPCLHFSLAVDFQTLSLPENIIFTFFAWDKNFLGPGPGRKLGLRNGFDKAEKSNQIPGFSKIGS